MVSLELCVLFLVLLALFVLYRSRRSTPAGSGQGSYLFPEKKAAMAPETSQLSTTNILRVSLPTPDTTCPVCFKKSQEYDILRCSNCKNQFYCSWECESKDREAHMFNCSFLPSGGMQKAEFQNREELAAEATRVSNLMKKWLGVAHSQGNDKFGYGGLPESLQIAKLQISTSFHYSSLPPSHEEYPFRVPLVLISRLFLMDLIAQLSPNSLDNLAESLNKIMMPTHVARVFGPKVVSRPADLSPGEYEILGNVAIPLTIMDPAMGLDQAIIERWIALGLGYVKLWNASRSDTVI